MEISKIEQFVNDEGKKISVVENISTGEKTFIGYMVISHKAMGMSVPVDFTIDAKNLKQAFKRFEESAISQIESVKSSMNKPQIEMPNGADIGIVKGSKNE